MKKNQPIWNVILWKTNGDEEFRVFSKKPNFKDIYPLINTDMIEITGVCLEDDNHSYDMYIDEESKLKNRPVNHRATKAWYIWLKKEGRICIPGDTINGDVAIIKKVTVKFNDQTKDIQSIA